MQFDKKINIAIGNSRKSISWTNTEMMWSQFISKLQTPIKSSETLAEYMRYPKLKQDELKDVGGFVGGSLSNGRRKTNNVLSRSLITLDLDNIPCDATEEIIKRVSGLGCSYAIYSTRKHEPIKPRLRVIIPTNRTMSADEYEPIARMTASLIGMQYADPTTFEVSRLMYWPSASSDSNYVCEFADMPFIDADGILNRYADWKDISSWPQVPGAPTVTTHSLTKQGDPEEKSGIVGAFCRTYDIYKAINELIPGQYVEATDGRYTFSGGSTTGGAVIYQDGKFLYSHHATDPASGKLCNSFDLVRLHLFGDMDLDAKADTPTNKLPSWQEMIKYVNKLPDISEKLATERYEKATEVFSDIKSNIIQFPYKNENTPVILSQAVPKIESDNWLKLLKLSTATGQPIKSSYNVLIALNNDPLLKGRIKKNTFSDSIEGFAPLPWGNRKNENKVFAWTDEDYAGLRVYTEMILGFRTKELIKDAFDDYIQQNSYDPVKDYLLGLQWDNMPRLDTMFIDFFGMDDDEYARAVSRKILVGAVARVMEPGVKFDYMPVIQGSQGIGKTTFCERLGKNWFTNSIKEFKDKTASELLQGTWIVEFGELEGFSKTDIRRIKGFLTQTMDHYRAAYASTTEKHPRKCVFFGTTNDYTYLLDPTGNRRFWPVDCNKDKIKLKVLKDLTSDYIDQLWAEAVVRWKIGEPLYLDDRLEKIADEKRDLHREVDAMQGQIEEFISNKIPDNWDDWDINKRQSFWVGFGNENLTLVDRDKVCAAEIWREMIGDRRPMSRQDSIRINHCLESIPGWERLKEVSRFGKIYGRQRGFRKKI